MPYLWHDRLEKRVHVTDKVLHCPSCGEQHVDQGEWAKRAHREHLCEKCDCRWAPSPHYTRGVRYL